MQIELNPSAEPLYAQIVAQVTSARDRGDLAPGDRLPTVRELAAQLGINRNTVAHAYGLLGQAGVIVGRPGRGSLVAAIKQRPPGAHSHALEHYMPVVASASEITLRCAGSHDFCLDLLARHLRHASPSIRLICTPVGSTAGLLALGSREAQLAGAHLLDPTTGEYNRPFVRRLLPGVALRLITLVEREQGLIVRRGNPLAIRGVPDLARPGLRCAIRQAGSGTRLLLDHLLALHHIAFTQLMHTVGPLATHLAVAAAVAGGRADAGLGVRAAARALDLDFVPLASERYDLAFRREDEHNDWVATLLETLASPALRADIESLEGYDATHTAWVAM